MEVVSSTLKCNPTAHGSLAMMLVPGGFVILGLGTGTRGTPAVPKNTFRHHIERVLVPLCGFLLCTWYVFAPVYPASPFLVFSRHRDLGDEVGLHRLGLPVGAPGPHLRARRGGLEPPPQGRLAARICFGLATFGPKKGDPPQNGRGHLSVRNRPKNIH